MVLIILFKKIFPDEYALFIKVSSDIIPAAIEGCFNERKQNVTRMEESLPKTVYI